MSGVDFGAFDPASELRRQRRPTRWTEITVKPTVNDDVRELPGSGAGIRVATIATGPSPWPWASSSSFSVEVTAEDGETAKTYTVTVTRAAAAPGLTTPIELCLTIQWTRARKSPWTWNTTRIRSTRLRLPGTLVERRLRRRVGNDRYVPGGRGPGVPGASPTTCAPRWLYRRGQHFVPRQRGAGLGHRRPSRSTPRSNNSRNSRRATSTDATLSGLDLSGVNFGTFDPATTGYTASVAHDVRQTTVTPTTNDNGATYAIKLDGVAGCGRRDFARRGRQRHHVDVTAEDGETTKTYTVTVTRDAPPLSTDATLSSLTLSDAPFTFASDTTSYEVNVAHDVDQTTVTATANDDGATYAIKLDGVTDADGVIPLAVGSNVITVEVTAEDGNTAKTYKVTVSRAAPAAPPDAPDQPTGEVLEPGKVTLDWEDVDGATGYQVGLWSQPNLLPLPSDDMPGVTVRMNGSSARLSGLPAEWSHYWLRVRASNDGGTSGWSDWLTLENQ